MKSDVSPIPKSGGFTGQSKTKNMLALGFQTKLVPYVGNIVQRLGDERRPIPTLVERLILLNLCEPPPFSKEGITTHS